MSNTLDGTLISPFSNITLARFGIPWGVKVELDTEGIVDFLADFPGQLIRFDVTSDLPTPGTFLYGITFLDGVAGSELYNFAPFTEFDSTKFKMNGSYNATTKVYSFQEPGGTIKTTGAKFWLRIRVVGSNFPSVSNIDISNHVQHPFQFTLAGAINGHQKTTHLFEKPEKELTLKMPYFKRTGPLIRENFFRVSQVWSTDGSRGSPDLIIGRRVSETLRASQPFEMLSKWGAGSTLAGTITTQSVIVEEDIRWTFDLDVFQTEHPECSSGGGQPLTDPGTQSGEIIYSSGPPTDSGDGSRGTFDATPPSQTLHRITQQITSPIAGSGQLTCKALITPPNGELRDTDSFIAQCDDIVPPPTSGDFKWGFDRWLEQ